MKFITKLNKERKNILFNLLILILDILIMVFFYQKVFLATILLIILSILALIKWKSWVTFSIFVVASIVGPICEIVLISQGTWGYPVQTILNIPLWLFILWGIAGAGLYQVAVELKRLGIKK
jgi:uncharacterized membrane protein YoaT (DUF817 family)